MSTSIIGIAEIGDIATARCYVEFASTRADRSPPEAYTAAGWDWFIFELQDASWAITGWNEAKEPEPHDEGAGTII